MQVDSDSPEGVSARAGSLRQQWLRPTLRSSQFEAVASSTTTATSDHFFNAFALFLGAGLFQMGWVSGLPQLFGAMSQLLSVWIASYFRRRSFIVVIAVIQALVVTAMAGLAKFAGGEHPVWLFIGLAMLYQSCLNLIQPHWRAWMGSVVPPRRRGAFFAARTRITMLSSLAVFLLGGGLLSWTDSGGMTWLGFALLFLAAACGRLISAWQLWKMHDPVPHLVRKPGVFLRTFGLYRRALSDSTFRQYSLFVAGMNAVVAISAPFFAVYMLQDLKLTYFQFVMTSVASVVTQFVTLRFWGFFSDRFGNRLTMSVTSICLPVLPLMWLFSDAYPYLIAIQVFSGLSWSGFTLSTANYLYDIRPHHTDFASYAALQSSLSASLVFFGAIGGGLVAAAAEAVIRDLHWGWLGTPVFAVFVTSAILRAAVAWWFLPRLAEPHVRPRPKLLQLVFRVRGFNAISGVALDWLTVVRRKKR